MAEVAPASSRAWRRRKSHRRHEIFVAARACLEEAGLQGVSVEMIGRRAGVSEATVYNYFESKSALPAAVIEQLRPDSRAEVSIDARLFVMARRNLTETRRNPRMHEAVYREMRWADCRGPAFHRCNQLYVGIFREVFDEAAARGELDDGLDPLICRDPFYGGLQHLAQRTILAGHEIDVSGTAQAYVRTLLRNWRSEPACPDSNPADRIETAVIALENLIVAQTGRKPRL